MLLDYLTEDRECIPEVEWLYLLPQLPPKLPGEHGLQAEEEILQCLGHGLPTATNRKFRVNQIAFLAHPTATAVLLPEGGEVGDVL